MTRSPLVVRRAFTGLVTLCLLLVGALSERAGAQATLTHTEDASPIPSGMLRVRITTGWTRFEDRFTASGGRRSLGDELSTDSLGARELPGLAPVEAGLRTLAGDPRLRLTLGRLQTLSDARIVTTPIAMEYGVTSRLSVGLVVPVVQTRRTIQLRVNQDSARLGNVGFVPERLRTAAAAANLQLYTAFQSAADSLGTLLSRCPSAPSAAGCASVNTSAAEAAATRVRVQQFTQALRAALGTDEGTTLVAPRTGSALATSIEAQRAALNAELRRFLGASAGAPTGVYTAGDAFSFVDLNGTGTSRGLLQSALGGGLDSLHTADRIGFGDIGLNVQFLLFDNFRRDTLSSTALQSRLAVAGGIRFATSRADSVRDIIDIPTGDGGGLEGSAAFDLLRGRLGATIAGRIAVATARTIRAALGDDPDAAFPLPLFGNVQR
ncbi:MAG: hypothetical protein H0W68_11685, partial [Gemmatimonadaceae bacterium]|nr:hypothetical protein [Gemmatimonadaceae bacterium]